MDLKVGDVIKMKKSHPCGTNAWELRRVDGYPHSLHRMRPPGNASAEAGRKGVPRICIPEWPISRKKLLQRL